MTTKPSLRSLLASSHTLGLLFAASSLALGAGGCGGADASRVPVTAADSSPAPPSDLAREEMDAPGAKSDAPAEGPRAEVRSAGAPPAPPPSPMSAPSKPEPSPAGAGKKAGRASAPPSAAVAGGAVTAPMQPVQQAGVHAGEWDDNANYREFSKWLGTESRLGFHKTDVRDRQFIVVRDADGKAVPRCGVTLHDERQHGTTLTTTASGRALLFPHAEGLEGPLTATARCQGMEKTVHFSASQPDGIVDLKLAQARKTPTREVDIGFILDTTGSMSEEITAVKATIQKVTRSLGADGIKVKIGLVEYKDRSDAFVTRVYPMTEDLGQFARKVEQLAAGGGGDYPESVNEGLHVGLNRLDWGDASTVKMAILIGDAPPHLDYVNDFDYAVEMKDAAHRGIQVFTIAASGMDEIGQVVWRQIAQYTDATNLFVMRGGAGSQSTGGGDPLSSCGGTQRQFRSGNLDALIVERVRRELKNIDKDPMRIPGVGVDENAKPCAQRLEVAG